MAQLQGQRVDARRQGCTREPSGVPRTFYILIVVELTQLQTFVQTLNCPPKIAILLFVNYTPTVLFF